MRRTALVWLVLFAAYLATLGLHAFGRSEYAGDEPHYLLAAKSIVDDGQIGGMLAKAMQGAGLSRDEQEAVAAGNCRRLLGLA